MGYMQLNLLDKFEDVADSPSVQALALKFDIHLSYILCTTRIYMVVSYLGKRSNTLAPFTLINSQRVRKELGFLTHLSCIAHTYYLEMAR